MPYRRDMRRLCLILALSPPLLLCSAAQASQPPHPDPLHLSFAVCAGRFTALASSSWQAPGQQVDSRADLQTMLDLLEAVGPGVTDQSAPAVALRLARAQARNATLRLLSIRRSQRNQRRGRLAQATLVQQRRVCEALIR